MALSFDPSLVSPKKGFEKHLNNGFSKVKKGIGRAVEETGDSGTVNNLAKFGRRAFGVVSAIPAAASTFGPAGTYFKGITDIFKVLSIFKNAEDVVKGESALKVASGVLGVSIAGMTAVQIMSAFKWFSLAKTAIPFGTVIDFIELPKNAIDIAISVQKLVQLSKRVSHLNDKKKFWKGGLDADRCKTRVRKYKHEGKALAEDIAQLTKKQGDVEAKAKKWSLRVEEKAVAMKEKLAKQKKICRIFTKIAQFFRKIIPGHTKRKARKWTNLNKKITKTLEQTRKIHAKKIEKKTVWKQMDAHFREVVTPENEEMHKNNQNQIDLFCKHKITQLNVKKKNVRWEQFKEVASIMLAVAASIIIISSIILTLTGTGGMATSIVLAAVGLAVSAFGLGMHFFKKYKKPKTLDVALPILQAEEKAKEQREKATKKKISDIEKAGEKAKSDMLWDPFSLPEDGVSPPKEVRAPFPPEGMAGYNPFTMAV